MDIYINGVRVDVPANLDFKINFETSDDDNFTSFKCNFSNSFVLPHTQTNDEIFGYQGILIMPSNNITTYKCEIVYNGQLLEVGTANILKIDNKGYTIRYISGVVDLFKKLDSMTVADVLDEMVDTDTSIKMDADSAVRLFNSNGLLVKHGDINNYISKVVAYTGVYEDAFIADKCGVSPLGETIKPLEWEKMNNAPNALPVGEPLDYTGTKLAWYERQVYNNSVGNVYGELRLWQCPTAIKTYELFLSVMNYLNSNGININAVGGDFSKLFPEGATQGDYSYNYNYNYNYFVKVTYFCEVAAPKPFVPGKEEVTEYYQNEGTTYNKSYIMKNTQWAFKVSIPEQELTCVIYLPRTLFQIDYYSGMPMPVLRSRKTNIYIMGHHPAAPNYVSFKESINAHMILYMNGATVQDSSSVQNNFDVVTEQRFPNNEFRGTFDLGYYVETNMSKVKTLDNGLTFYIELPLKFHCNAFEKEYPNGMSYFDFAIDEKNFVSTYELRWSDDVVNINLQNPDEGFNKESTLVWLTQHTRVVYSCQTITNTRSDQTFSITKHREYFPQLGSMTLKTFLLGILKMCNIKMSTDLMDDGNIRINLHPFNSIIDETDPVMDITKYLLLDKEYTIEPSSAYSYKRMVCKYQKDPTDRADEYFATWGEEYGAKYFENSNGTIDEEKVLFELPFRTPCRYLKKSNLFLGRTDLSINSYQRNKYSDYDYKCGFEKDRKQVEGIYISFGLNAQINHVVFVNDLPDSDFQSFRVNKDTQPSGVFTKPNKTPMLAGQVFQLATPREPLEHQDIEGWFPDYVNVNKLEDFINDRYDINTKRVTCWMRFYDCDISNAFLRKSYVFEGVQVVIQSITEYSPVTKVGKVVMYTVKDINNYMTR